MLSLSLNANASNHNENWESTIGAHILRSMFLYIFVLKQIRRNTYGLEYERQTDERVYGDTVRTMNEKKLKNTQNNHRRERKMRRFYCFHVIHRLGWDCAHNKCQRHLLNIPMNLLIKFVIFDKMFGCLKASNRARDDWKIYQRYFVTNKGSALIFRSIRMNYCISLINFWAIRINWLFIIEKCVSFLNSACLGLNNNINEDCPGRLSPYQKKSLLYEQTHLRFYYSAD